MTGRVVDAFVPFFDLDLGMGVGVGLLSRLTPRRLGVSCFEFDDITYQ